MKLEIRDDFNLKTASESFIEYLDVCDNSLKTYEKEIKYFIEWLSDNNIKYPSRTDFRKFRDELKERKGIHTTNSYLTPVRLLFRYLELNKIYDDITEGIKNIKTNNIPKKQTLTLEQMQMMAEKLDDPRDKAIFSLAITTGMRISEIVNSKLEDIKLYNGDMCLFFKGKGYEDKSSYVKLSPQTIDIINKYIEQRSNKDCKYIFASEGNRNARGNHLTEKTGRLIIKNIFKKFGIEENQFSAHSMRRSCATLVYKETKDIMAVKNLLRHKSIQTTQRYIAQITRDDDKSEYIASNLVFGVQQ